MYKTFFQSIILFSLVIITMIAVAEPQPVRIGLNADLSAADAESGEAIRRGALLAMAEINAAGGVLGRPLSLDVRDHRRNPARGVANVQAFAAEPDLVAIIGGKHTPVIFAELDAIHAHRIPYLIPWAAGTGLVDNGYTPNFVFRVSVRDEYAGRFLVEHALERGYQRLGLVLEQTGWGRSNELAVQFALADHGLRPTHTEWFNWGESDFKATLRRLEEVGVDVVIFVGNAPDGVSFIRALAQRPAMQRLPVISHWGISGGEFTEPLGEILNHVDLVFLQTFSFLAPPFPERAARVFQDYQQHFAPVSSPAEIAAPTGLAHAYDLVHLLALAIEHAGSTERSAVRDALEHIRFHAGLLRDYQPPFTSERHDALTTADYRLARYVNGMIVPLAIGLH